MRIRRAAAAEAEALTALAHRAKRHWGYGDALMALWREELTLTPAFIAAAEVFIAEQEGTILGTYAVVPSGTAAALEHFWIEPGVHGQGIGRALFAHAAATARAHGVAHLRIVSDPNAEGFYLRMGAERVGVAPGLPAGRELPVLRFDVATAPPR